jgi:uncharacterized protein with von Willebrand factor type A (vWA) domain
MARTAKAGKTTRSTTAANKTKAPRPAASKRSPLAIEKRKPGRPKTAVRVPSAPPAPKVSKDELRAQVDKLEQLVASLRAKSRETNKAAKVATARIAELESQVATLEKKVAAPPPSVRASRPPKPPRAKHRGREIDPGDAVPPGVAVEEPAPLDDEAETALENLEAHLPEDDGLQG